MRLHIALVPNRLVLVAVLLVFCKILGSIVLQTSHGKTRNDKRTTATPEGGPGW